MSFKKLGVTRRTLKMAKWSSNVIRGTNNISKRTLNDIRDA